MKAIAIVGSTGSIGQSALAVVDANADRLRVVALAAGENVERFYQQIERYRPALASLSAADALTRLQGVKPHGTGQGRVPPGVTLAPPGRAGLIAVASHPDAELVLFASSGTDSLEAVLAAIDCGKTIALANKEILVMAGGIVTEAARRRGVAILPVDSEHNAIHQCLHGRTPADIKRLVLTASGGPFRGWSGDRLAGVTAADALRHPTWQMGPKITVDSATLMNKALEVIEARWLFGLAAEQIDVIVHPESVIHSFVEFNDGSVLAQLSPPDMRLPIQLALLHPARVPGPAKRLNWQALAALNVGEVLGFADDFHLAAFGHEHDVRAILDELQPLRVVVGADGRENEPRAALERRKLDAFVNRINVHAQRAVDHAGLVDAADVLDEIAHELLHVAVGDERGGAHLVVPELGMAVKVIPPSVVLPQFMKKVCDSCPLTPVFWL